MRGKKMAGRSDYEERRQARIEGLKAAAEGAAAESDKKAAEAFELVEGIPFGQPNIEGRSDLPQLREKSMRKLGQSVRLEEKAKNYVERAEAAENNTAISSDDPQAIEKLKAKVAALEAQREKVKAENKEARKNGTQAHPSYSLSYLARDIKVAKERIEQLEKVAGLKDEKVEFPGGSVEIVKAANRIIFRFDERQSAEVTNMLKKRAFKWSPQADGWQRMITGNAIFDARIILGQLRESCDAKA